MVGLTGNFGSGKSTVALFFRGLGAQVLDSDRLAHEVFRRENPLYPRIHSLFPELGGRFTRTDVARVVFRNSKKRRALESLIHPYVFRRIREGICRSRVPVMVLEIPLLFESGFDRQCDLTVVVKAPAGKVVRRLAAKGFRRTDAEERWRAQWPLAKKLRRSDCLVDNSKGRGETRRQVVRIWKKIERSLRKHGQRER